MNPEKQTPDQPTSPAQPIGPAPETNSQPPAAPPQSDPFAASPVDSTQQMPAQDQPLHQQPTVQQPQSNWQQPAEPKKSKAGLIIAIVSVVLILLVGGVLGTLVLLRSMSSNSRTNSPSDSGGSSTKLDPKANAVTAKYLSDFEVVCDGGSVTNAAAATKPYKIVSFSSRTPQNDRWSSMSLGFDQPYYVDSKAVDSVSVVACLKMAEGSTTKSKTCEFESGGNKVNIDFYATQYDLTYYEAKTGKALAKGEPINGPATTCPFFTSYDKNDPKIYADPDENAVELVHAKFAQ